MLPKWFSGVNIHTLCSWFTTAAGSAKGNLAPIKVSIVLPVTGVYSTGAGIVNCGSGNTSNDCGLTTEVSPSVEILIVKVMELNGVKRARLDGLAQYSKV